MQSLQAVAPLFIQQKKVELFTFLENLNFLFLHYGLPLLLENAGSVVKLYKGRHSQDFLHETSVGMISAG
jgi:hypothetical protein